MNREHSLVATSDIPGAIHLVRSVVMGSALDCDCRERVDEALRQLEHFERHRNNLRLISAAREQRRKIGLLLEMLADFGEADEADEGVLESAALLFRDIAAAAREGAHILDEISPADALPATCDKTF